MRVRWALTAVAAVALFWLGHASWSEYACAAGNCSPGTFSQTGSTPCTNCSPGTYQPEVGQTACFDCPPGNFTPNSGQASCTACAVGRYAASTGSTVCATCNPGTFTGNTGSTSCTNCSPGNYQPASAASTCFSCNPGTFTASIGATACTNCSLGTYQSLPASSTCTNCAPGSFAGTTGLTNCTLCAPGRFESTTGSSACKTCSPGSFTGTPGSSSCTNCSPGSYQPVSAASICLSCNPGTFTASIGATACTNCSLGRYQSLPGSSTCTDCAPGSYAGSTGQTNCTLCAVGRFASTTGSSVCANCGVGTFSASLGATSCTNCSPGLYQSSTGSSSCLTCNPGTFNANSGAATCTNCSPGRFTASVGSTVCSTCPAGKTSSPGATVCTNCSLGTYAPTPGSPACINCSPGTYAPVVSSTICLSCVPGKFASSPGASSCTNCSPGSFSSLSGAAACTSCAPGFFASASGASSCSTCSAGQTSATGALACTSCPANAFSSAGSSSCFCNAGTFWSGTACVTCPVGMACPGGAEISLCSAGYFVAAGDSCSSSTPPSSTLDLVVNSNPSQLREYVTYTASIAGGSGGTPSGTVQFVYPGGSSPLLAVTPIGGNASQARWVVSNHSVGNFSVGAFFQSSGPHLDSSDFLTQLVQDTRPVVTATSLASNPNPQQFGLPVTFTATVTAGIGVPTGIVGFYRSDPSLGLVLLGSKFAAPGGVNQSVASLQASSLAFGNQTVWANFVGNASFKSSDGSVLQQMGPVPTTTSLSSVPNPSTVGQLVVFTAFVSSGSGAPTGSVTFFDGPAVIGSATLSFYSTNVSRGNFSTSFFAPGNRSITAQYLPTGVFATSTSNLLIQNVTCATISLGALPPTGQIGVFYSGSAAASGGIAPYSYSVNSGALPGGLSLDGGTGAVTGTPQATGPFGFSILAVDSNGCSASKGYSVTISGASTTTSVISNRNPSQLGVYVTFTAFVDAAVNTPTGTVRFGGPGWLSPQIPLSPSGPTSSTASYVKTNLSLGTYGVSAQYTPTSAHLGSLGNVSQTVLNTHVVTTATSLSSSPNPQQLGLDVTFTAVVASSPAAFGNVDFYRVDPALGPQLLGSVGVSPTTANTSVALFTTANLSPGSHGIHANFVGLALGNFSWKASTGILTQTIDAPAATTTVVLSSVNPSALNQLVLFTAQVSSGSGLPTGSVLFRDGPAVIGSAPLSFFSANVSSGNFSTSLLASGNHSITAEYVPAGFFAASTSPPLAQVVLPPSAVADLAMTKTDGLTTVTAGQPVVYTIVVQNLGPDLVGGATVSDVLPALLQGATWTCAASPGSSCTPAGSGSINDTVNLLVSGTASYVVTATVDPAASGSLVNTASVAVPLGVLDPNLANNSATDVDAITPAGPSRVFVSVLGLDTNDCSNVATPCRTLDAAIGQVAVEGQVIVIGTGSYAGATITKSVKIDVAPGAVAYSGQPFTVNAGPASTVVIRGLTLKALTPGTGTGLLIQSAGAVLVERSVIDGWGTGILTQSVAEVFVNDSTIRNNVTGVGATTGDVSLDNVRLTNNGTAIDAQTALSLRGATASGNATGISAGTGSSVTVEKTQIANNGTGVSVPAGSGATARLSRCVVSGNVLGLENVGGTIEVSGNNVVRGNTTNTSGAITTTGLQ